MFAKSYKEWRDREIKKGRGKRFSPNYYEKIAQDLLDEFAKYLLELPEVCVVPQKELDDPNWKPPFDTVKQ